MRFKTVYLLSIAVLLLCVSPSLGKKPVKPQPPAENFVDAGFDCSVQQAVCTDGPLNEFERTALYSFAASYQSTGDILLHSELGEPFAEFVRNDPDNICGVLGEEFHKTVTANKFTFSGNSNTYEAAVGWKFVDQDWDVPDDFEKYPNIYEEGYVTLEKVSFSYRDEAFAGFNEEEDDPFVGVETTIENWAVLARVEGYVPVGAKRGKGIQCFWLIDDDPANPPDINIVFTVDGTD